MTALKALAILEAAVLECKKRNINTLEVRDALNFLEPHTKPPWLILQYRNPLDRDWTTDVGREGQQQVLRATFPGIRSSVKELLGKQIDALARRIVVSQDAKVGEEIERLATEYGKRGDSWVFVERTGFTPDLCTVKVSFWINQQGYSKLPGKEVRQIMRETG